MPRIVQFHQPSCAETALALPFRLYYVGMQTSDRDTRIVRQLPGGNISISHVVEGRVRVRTGDEDVMVEAGESFVAWPETPIERIADPAAPWRYYWVRLEGEGAVAFARDCGFERGRTKHRPPKPTIVVRAMQKLYELATDPLETDAYIINRELMNLAAGCRSARPGLHDGTDRRSLVIRAKALIESSLDSRITVTELVDALHTSRSTLLRAFREAHGRTPHEHIQWVRLRRSKEFLLETSHKIVTIAKLCGFTDDKHFQHAFRQAEGMPPGEWRRRNR